jgi:hypothetical protein
MRTFASPFTFRAAQRRGRLSSFAAVAVALQSIASCGGDTETPAGEAGGTGGKGGAAGSAGSMAAGNGGSSAGKAGNAGSSGKAGNGGSSGASGDGGRESDGGHAGTGALAWGGEAGSSGETGGGGGSAAGVGDGGKASAGEGSGASGAGGDAGGESGAAGAAGGSACDAGEQEDRDADGVTIAGGDCDDCDPLVNPAAFEVPGNELDDDCDATTDVAEPCDAGIASSTADALDFAKAIDLCSTTTDSGPTWGVLQARLSLSDGAGSPYAAGHAVRPHFGTGRPPFRGHALAVLSTGHAAATGDVAPAPASDEDASHDQQSALPADFLAANDGRLPEVPGCPPISATAHDSEMLVLRVRVPTNARSFSLQASFYSFEYPEWVCSSYNDFFVVLLDSAWNGTPANPADKNLAVYEDQSGDRFPLGTNLAYANTGLFSQCVNGATGCGTGAIAGSTTTCVQTTELVGTGFDAPRENFCASNSLAGGATGFRTISGNVIGGEVITLRIGLWDSGDDASDSTVVLDAFEWSTETITPGAT